MLVLHALWSLPGRLCLWAEDASLLATPPDRAAPKPSARSPGHPFAASCDGIAEGLVGWGLAASGPGEAGSITLLLPSSRSRPLPSPVAARLGSRPGSRARPGLRPWRVPTVVPEPAAALDVLMALPERSAPTTSPWGGSQPLAGGSLRWFTAVGELALELVARGRILPAMVTRHPGASEARWLPVPAAGDEVRLRALAEAMPPLCRAEVGSDAGAAPAEPGAVLSGALAAFVDRMARSALASYPPMRPRRGRAKRAPAATAEAVVQALIGKDPDVAADPEELAKLSQALLDWRRSGLREAGPLRTCFRLAAPTDGEDTLGGEQGPGHPAPAGAGAGAWRLEFLLQSAEDPSLLVAAEDVWRAGPGLRSLRHATERPQEHLLADLGRATRLYPDLERALDVARPSALALDAAGAHGFLTGAAPLLEQAGFGVLVPQWWRSPAARLGLRLSARPKPGPGPDATSGRLGLDGLCDYRYDVALGGELLGASELADLARLKAPLVRIRGRWVELSPGDIEAALAVLDRQAGTGSGQMAAAAVLRVGLGLDPAPGTGLPVVAVEAEGWLGELLSPDDDRRLEPMPTPARFEGELRPYQERGLGWLSFLGRLGLGACLADDMGLGKTAQLLALLLAERAATQAGAGAGRRRRARPRPTLLVCPMSVVGNWQREAARFAPDLAVHVHHGTGRETGAAFTRNARAADLVVTTYSLVARDRELLGKVRWGRVALDEAQNVKNPASQAARSVRGLRADTRVALTGTPVENRLLELWSLMDFLNPGLLGPQGTFRRRFAVPVERYRDEEAARILKRLTGPFVLRRLKTDRAIIADLPEKIEMKVLTNLTKEQASLYQAVVDDMLARIEESEGIERKGLVLSTMLKLKQVCNHPAHLLGDGSRLPGRSGKLARLEEILEEVLAGGERALCFTQFAEMGRMLQGHLAERLGAEVPFLHGGVGKPRRDEMVARFQADAGPPVLLLSLKAGGVGLNLTAANHVVHFDRWWNPAVEDQATDRAFRIGQRRDVQVRKFVCVGTLEERIDAMIEDKRDLAARIVGTGEAWLTELSTADLRDLVALSADAVAEA